LHTRSERVAEAVTVAVPARLHLGFLDPSGGCGRRFGGIGLAITGLETRITVRSAVHAVIDGPQHERVRSHLERMQRLFHAPGAHAVVEEVVPAHVGLGSGTQVALAVAAAVRRLQGCPLDLEADALTLGRGARSGLGIGLFRTGGLVVDGGRGPATTVPPIISRMHFPEEWRVLVVLDPARRGVHGQDEIAAFAALPPFPRERAAENCRLILMAALPGLAEHDLASFGRAIAGLQAHSGDYFGPIQGGRRFSSPEVEAALLALEAEGAVGVGQSSWGPTGFAFAASAAEADRLVQRVRQDGRLHGLDVRICQGLNRGAQIDARRAVTTSET
jgi:beta-ribofuranosylaminobenzene 5'-phosphate synthase